MLQSSKHTVNAAYAKVTETKHLRDSDLTCLMIQQTHINIGKQFQIYTESSFFEQNCQPISSSNISKYHKT